MTMSSITTKRSWLSSFVEDLRPTPGRTSKAFRIVLVCVITVITIMTFRLPFSTLGLYFIFLANRMNPGLSLRSSLFYLLSLITAVGAEWGFVAISGNDPVVRLLSVVLVIFVCGIFIHEATIPALGVITGSLYTVLIAQWEFDARPNDIVENSLWSIVTLSVGLAVSVVVEYVFASKDPSQMLMAEFQQRYGALKRMFFACANAAPKDELVACVTQVGRLAAAGQVEMRRLYFAIQSPGIAADGLPARMEEQVAMLARLVDLSAAFGADYVSDPKSQLSGRCAEIAPACAALELNPRAQIDYNPIVTTPSGYLSRVERSLNEILNLQRTTPSAVHPELTVVPVVHAPIITREAFTNGAALRFALKLSCCGALCYVFYHAAGWPGMFTCVVTVMIAGLDDTGASKERLSLRLAGMVIGGVLFGLGSIVFLYPHMDSVVSLVCLVAAVSFVGAWFGSGRRFGFLGPQTAYAFFLVAIVGYRPSIALLPVKDNLAGFAFAAVVMWVVFDHLATTPTEVLMRRLLTDSLRVTADLLHLMEAPGDRSATLIRGRILRYRMGKLVGQIRTENDTVEYEFGSNHAANLEHANRIVDISFDAASLFWEELAILYGDPDEEDLTNPEMIRIRREISASLLSLAGQLDDRKPVATAELGSDRLINDQGPALGRAYAQRAIRQYQKIETAVQFLLSQKEETAVVAPSVASDQPLR
jgi:multidrug resistance protein MdtO